MAGLHRRGQPTPLQPRAALCSRVSAPAPHHLSGDGQIASSPQPEDLELVGRPGSRAARNAAAPASWHNSKRITKAPNEEQNAPNNSVELAPRVHARHLRSAPSSGSPERLARSSPNQECPEPGASLHATPPLAIRRVRCPQGPALANLPKHDRRRQGFHGRVDCPQRTAKGRAERDAGSPRTETRTEVFWNSRLEKARSRAPPKRLLDSGSLPPVLAAARADLTGSGGSLPAVRGAGRPRRESRGAAAGGRPEPPRSTLRP
mmetsp:Transcript_23143/g.38074  ORF Transcript_23143/g.38074 Transcript_23143/m.38074 type:complete len:262 (+) Transcript_23143:430-1215(+)